LTIYIRYQQFFHGSMKLSL